jgi:sugar/nucleoside kinase (ribokinase family)
VDHMPTKAGGCAANVAIDLAKQRLAVEVSGCLGNDSSARVLLASLEENKVDTQRVVYSVELPTSKTVILLVVGQDRRYIHSFGANAAFKVTDIDLEWVSSLSVFYLGGLFLMPAIKLDELLDLLKFCREKGVITVVDVVIPQNKPITDDIGPLLSAIDYFLPNEDEAQLMTGISNPIRQLQALIHMGANTVIITRGRQGVIAGRGREFWQAGIYDMPNGVDPSGCGDAFAAGLVTGIVRGQDLPSMIRYASALGASAIRALGTTDGVFTSDQAEEFIKTNPLAIQTGQFS